MAERLAYLEAVVGADVTQFRKGMRDIRNEVGFLSETMSGMAGLGRSLTFAFTTPVLALGTAAISAASGFEASMYNINSIAGLTADELDALGQKTLEFGARTRAGAQAASEALYTVFSAGITNVDDAFAVMQVATRTAEAGLADLTITTEGLVAILLSYGDTSEAAANQASDAITRMVALGVGSMQTFMTALSSVVPTASAIGMEFNDLAADMAFLTQRGLSASRAGVSMNAVLTQMLNPTEAMSAAFAELGARGLPDLIEQFGGVNEAIMALIGTADGDVSQLFEMFNSIQARRAIGLFAEGQEAWQQTLVEFEQGVAGSTTRAWEEQMKSFAASWDLLMSAVTGAGIAIGQTLLPVLQPFVKAITDLLLVVVDTNPELLGMGAAFVSVAAAIPPLLWLIGSLVTPFGLVLGAVSALVVAFATDFGGIATSVKQTVDKVLADLQPLIDIMNTMWDTIFPQDMTMGELPALTGDAEGALMATINPQTNAISLWDYYVDEGFIETMSWNEFMDLATEGGWDGGQIDVGEMITLNWSGLTDQAPDGAAMLAAVDWVEGDLVAAPDTDSLWTNIAQGIGAAWPAIQAELVKLWAKVDLWLFGQAKSLFDALATGIASINEDSLYNAFTELLQGDIIGAINAIFPSLGTSIAEGFNSIDWGLSMPYIGQRLTDLMNQIGDWFTTEGVPLISRSLGYLTGRIGVILGDAFEGIFGFFTGGGAGDAMGYFGESIGTPFMEGLNDALDDGETTNPAQRLIEGLMGAIVTISAANLLLFSPAATAIGGALSLALGGLSWLTGAATVIGNIANALGISAAVSAAWTPVATAFSTAFGSAMATVTGAWAATTAWIAGIGTAFMTAVGGAISAAAAAVTSATTWVATTVASLGTAMSIALAAVVVTAGIIIGTITYIALPQEVKDALFNAISGLIDGVFGEGATHALQSAFNDWLYGLAADIAEAFGNTDLAAQLRSNIGSMTGENAIPVEVDAQANVRSLEMAAPTAVFWSNDGRHELGDVVDTFIADEIIGTNDVITLNDLSAIIELSNPDMQFAPMTEADLEQIRNNPELLAMWEAQLAALGYDVTIDPTITVTVDTSNATISTAPMNFTYDEMMRNGMIANNGVMNMTPETPPIVTIPEVQITPLSASFAEDLAGGASVDSIIAENFVPLENAWTAMFAPEGLMQTTFNTFSGAVALGWTNIETEINDVIGLLNGDMPAAISTFETNKDPFIEALGAVEDAARAAKDEVSGLVGAIAGLLELDTTMNVTLTITANQTDGNHKTGLMSVPYDGYVAELHRGEMVLTKNEANQYRDADIAPEAAMPTTSGRGGDTYENAVTIQGNLTVDQMIYELKRRGIDLTKVK